MKKETKEEKKREKNPSRIPYDYIPYLTSPISHLSEPIPLVQELLSHQIFCFTLASSSTMMITYATEVCMQSKQIQNSEKKEKKKR